MSSKQDFIVGLELFLAALSNSKVLLCDNIYKSHIRICVETLSYSNDNQCVCIVTDINTGETRRCSRTKKHGNVCGLHHKRKNVFKTINNELSTQVKKFYSLDLVSKPKVSKEKTDKFVTISWNSIDYLVNVFDGSVYYDDNENWNYIDNISNLNIPILVS